MITIKFDNQLLYLNILHLDRILESLRIQNVNIQEYLDAYSFPSPDALYNLIQDKDNLIIYYHQYLPEELDTLNPQHHEIILKCLEQLYIYQRDFPLLQMDYYPDDQLTIYTYSQVWEEDFEKFREAPNQEYTWDNLPKTLKSPNSNMQVQYYLHLTRIATVYHYYTL